MASLEGTQIIAPIVMPNDADMFATHFAKYGCGNIHSIVTLDDRDAISLDRREIGMLCYVRNLNKFYQLIGGINNTNWIDLDTRFTSTQNGNVNGNLTVNGNIILNSTLLKSNSNIIQLRNSNDTDYADLVVNNLTVKGTTTTVDSEIVNIADNIVVLNSNVTTGTPTENGGIQISRGSQPKASLIWNQSNSKWTAGLDGSENNIILETDISIAVNNNSIVRRDNNGNINVNVLNSTASSGTAPLTVSSDTKVIKLNADMLDGYHANNNSDNIPISNGIVNTNLNADMLDGYHANNNSNNIPISNGAVNTNLNADKLDGYDANYFAPIASIPNKLSQLTNDTNYITSAGAPVQSVAGKTGAVTLTRVDVGATRVMLGSQPTNNVTGDLWIKTVTFT